MYYLLRIIKITLFAILTITLSKVIFGKKYLPLQKPHENFDLARTFYILDIFSMKNRSRIHKILIHKLHDEDTISS